MKLAGVVAGIYLGLAWKARSAAALFLGFDPPGSLASTVIFLFAVLAYVLVHELGHRVAGAAQGWRCIRFGFGPFEFARQGKCWQVERVKWCFGAFVRQVPPSFTHFRRQKAMTLLSGPIASLLFAVASRLYCIQVYDRPGVL